MKQFTIDNAFPERHTIATRDDHEPGKPNVEAIYHDFSVRRCDGCVEFLLEVTRVYANNRHVSRLESFSVECANDLQAIIDACQRELDDVSWVVAIDLDNEPTHVLCERGAFNPKNAIKHHPDAYANKPLLMSHADAQRVVDEQNAQGFAFPRHVERWHK